MTAQEQQIDTIPAGTYSDLKDFLQDFGDIVHSPDEKDNERLHDSLQSALYYLEGMKVSDHLMQQNINITQSMILSQIGHELVKAAYNNGYRAKHFKEAK